MKVGDLIMPTACYPDGPIAIVLSTVGVPLFNRIKILFPGESQPEHAEPEKWMVVSSKNESR